MVTYKDTTQVASYMLVSLIWIKTWGRMWHNMLEWLVIYLLNELALYLCKGGLFFEFIKRNSKIALPIILGKQTNYKLYIHYTVHYTVHYEPYRPELSTPETSQERGHMWEML